MDGRILQDENANVKSTDTTAVVVKPTSKTPRRAFGDISNRKASQQQFTAIKQQPKNLFKGAATPAMTLQQKPQKTTLQRKVQFTLPDPIEQPAGRTRAQEQEHLRKLGRLEDGVYQDALLQELREQWNPDKKSVRRETVRNAKAILDEGETLFDRYVANIMANEFST